MKKKPRVLLYDIENTPTVVTTWSLWEANAIETLEEWYILSYAWKWKGEKTVHVVGLPDFKGYNKDKKNDKALCESLQKLQSEADILVAQNGDSHDQRKANARFIYHNLKPPAPYKTIDTYKIAKRYFKFNSNSLNALGVYFGFGEKLENSGIKLWRACMNGDLKAWKLMKKYNKRDVVLLEKVYDRLLPWISNHPNLNLYERKEHKCPVCLSSNYQKRGIEPRLKYDLERLQCKCGKWFYGSKIYDKKRI